ncbi:ribonuclease R [Salinarimonas rosea]|uniref:ribonuclease R n=1 Tax=Salinarimonas rosea TaxID=552063 RepID=UPI00040AE3CD|nr:ribonuclease R [Salinarimonas rosea]
MPKRKDRIGPSDVPGLPSREAVVAFVRAQPGKVGKREIARAFGITGGDKIWLKQLIRDLEDDGVIERRRKSLFKAGALPPMTLADVVARDADGELIATPAEWDADTLGPAPKILIEPARRSRPGQPAPGLNDRVLVRVQETGDPEGPPYAGRVVKVLEKSRAQVLGIFRPLPSGGGRLVPVDKKGQGREIAIRPGDEGDAREGDLVSATLTSSPRAIVPLARVRERLGSVKSEKAVSLIALVAHGIPHVFPRGVLDEAAGMEPVRLDADGREGTREDTREDWRDLPLVTIDPPDAKDHDDAVHARPDDDPGNEGGHVLTIAIADVAAYVRPGSAMDREAQVRGNSVYFPDRVVPMLPERISNDLCSLRPHEDRPALAVRITVGRDGRKIRHSFHRIAMRSAARLAYAQAQAAIDGAPDETTGPLLEPVLRPLWEAYACVLKAREARDPLALDLPERKIVLKPDGTVDRVLTPERLDAHKLIEEFMILANVAAAEALEKAKVPFVYRAHDEPSLEKMHALGEVLASIAMKLPKSGPVRATLFNRVLQAVDGMEHETFINEVVLRTQAQAEYTAENYGHFGLNLRRYAHFTSPIRRYADLIVHRALIRAHGFGPGGLPAETDAGALAEIAARISAAERRAMVAERETIDRLIAHHMAEHVGETFTGRIAGVTKAGLFVKLAQTGADGFVPAATIGADFYRYDEGTHALVGARTGETYRLGDTVEVKLVEAAPIAGALRFELLSEGSAGTPSGTGPRGRNGLRDGGPRRSKGPKQKGFRDRPEGGAKGGATKVKVKRKR